MFLIQVTETKLHPSWIKYSLLRKCFDEVTYMHLSPHPINPKASQWCPRTWDSISFCLHTPRSQSLSWDTRVDHSLFPRQPVQWSWSWAWWRWVNGWTRLSEWFSPILVILWSSEAWLNNCAEQLWHQLIFFPSKKTLEVPFYVTTEKGIFFSHKLPRNQKQQ